MQTWIWPILGWFLLPWTTLMYMAVAGGMSIQATNGKLDELVLDPNSGEFTYLLMRESHLWVKKLVTIPVSAVDTTDREVIYLKINEKEVAELPRVPIKMK